MPSTRNIADIKSALLHPATTSHFDVFIDKPANLTAQYMGVNGVIYNQDRLNLMCSEATLPGSNLATLELTNDHTGVTERHAYRRVYDDRIDLTFYVDVDNYLPIRFFETWIKYIAQESISDAGDRGVGLDGGNYFYRFAYRDDYASDGLQITKFEKSMMAGAKGSTGKALTYKFVKAFPISISSMPVSYDSSSLLKCTVSMTYMRYYIERYGGGAPDNPTGTPTQQAQFNSTNKNLTGTGALGVPITGFNIGGIPTSVAKSSGNTVS
jgi:hypothetical protein